MGQPVGGGASRERGADHLLQAVRPKAQASTTHKTGTTRGASKNNRSTKIDGEGAARNPVDGGAMAEQTGAGTYILSSSMNSTMTRESNSNLSNTGTKQSQEMILVGQILRGGPATALPLKAL